MDAWTGLKLNHGGPWREVERHGRRYLVSSAVIIVPGVLNGSKGALYYPPEQVSHDVQRWNGVPITLGHPTVDQDGVTTSRSARNPDVWDAVGLGYVYAASYQNNKLTTEAWIDIDKANKVNPLVVRNIRSGLPLEVSTGLFTTDIPAANGSQYQGTPYQYVATDYRPDHLAILLDQPGACSVSQGCGLNMNQRMVDTLPVSGEQAVGFWTAFFQGLGLTRSTNTVNVPVTNISTDTNTIINTGEPDVDKTQLIQWLTTNCECYKDAESQTALNGMTAPMLTKLKTQAEKSKSDNEMIQAAQQGFGGGPMATYNSVTKRWETAGTASPVAPLPTSNTQTPANVQHVQTTTTPTLNAEDQQALAWARSQYQQRKQQLIQKLVVNVSTDQQAAKAQELQSKSVEDLEYMAQFVPQAMTPEYFQGNNAAPNYTVAGTRSGVTAPAMNGNTQVDQQTHNSGPLPRFYEEEDEAAA